MSAEMTVQGKQTKRLDVILSIGLGVCALLLCLCRLSIYPSPWFDEGLNLQAAKNIAVHGQYGLRSGNDFTEFDPAIQTGPTVLLPIAWLFHVAGIGILQARLVAVSYTVLALVVFYWLVHSVYDRKVAVLASLLLLFTFDHEFTSFVSMGRQVLGEVPALAFFWLGTLLWLKALPDARPPALSGAGILWGLALLTKVQFAMILPVALFLFWVLDRVSGKRLRLREVVVPLVVCGLCVLAWYGYQALSLGFAHFRQQMSALGVGGGMHFLHFAYRRSGNAIADLAGSTLFILGLPGMLYATVADLQDRRKGYNQLFLVVFSAVWLGWYAFLSIGWIRYAFVPAAISAIFSARLLGDLWHECGRHGQALSHRFPVTSVQLAVGGMMVMVLLSGILPMSKEIIFSPDGGLQKLADYLNTYIPKDAVIESWEWEVDVLTDHIYHHPPYAITNVYTEHVWYNTSISVAMYDPMAAGPSYLIVGSFAKWTGIYSPILLEQRCTPVQSIGEYDLYELNR